MAVVKPQMTGTPGGAAPERTAADAAPGASRRASDPLGAVVATAHPHATEAARRILQRGGNAVDAAVAAAWVLSVCEPSGSGVGGQTTMLIRFPQGEALVLDGHSRAPAAVTRRAVSRLAQRTGPCATTIPSTPATLALALERHGRFSPSAVLAPAIELAEEGFPVTRLLRRHLQWCRKSLAASELGARRFLRDGKPLKRGAILRQPELAETLRRIATAGAADFYRGQLADRWIPEMEVQGGLLSARDLETFDLPVTRAPLEAEYRGHRVLTAPPPGGGVQLLLGLQVLDRLGLSTEPAAAAWYETIARVTRLVFQERERWPFAHEEMPASFLSWLCSPARAGELAERILAGGDRSSGRSAEGPGDTTHLCVADGDGLVVALTQSVQSLFGAKVGSARLGFFYNNYLCTCPRYRHPSRLRGGASPQSNAAPTVVLRRNAAGLEAPVLAVGAAGSRRITSSILQVTANMLHRGMSLAEAMDAPRVHATASGRLMLERRAATPEVLDCLSRRFRPIQIKAARSYAMGGVQAIARDATGGWSGAADPRRDGVAGDC